MDRLELLRVLEKRVGDDFLQISDGGAQFLFRKFDRIATTGS